MNIEDSNNWRLNKNLDKGRYCFLIGANNWAVELDINEFDYLYKLLIKLQNQLISIEDELMDEELINLEIEISPWYAELEGSISQWDLRLVLEGSGDSRSFEMYWPIQIAQTLLIEIIKMWESMH